jgi:hypothetical protein
MILVKEREGGEREGEREEKREREKERERSTVNCHISQNAHINIMTLKWTDNRIHSPLIIIFMSEDK